MNFVTEVKEIKPKQEVEIYINLNIEKNKKLVLVFNLELSKGKTAGEYQFCIIAESFFLQENYY